MFGKKLVSQNGKQQIPKIVAPGRKADRGRATPVRALAVGLAAGAATLVAYLRFFRPWHQRWGATGEEVAASMPGDEEVAHPLEVTTRAVTVHARPEHIWPWLVQMGNGRGGLYSYDWIDLLIGAIRRPSVDTVLPEFQDLKVGDTLPYAAGADMLVKALEPNRTLLLYLQVPGVEVAQSWRLYPLDAESTRLVLRVRAGAALPPQMIPMMLFLDISEFFMVRQQLLGIKARAEALARRQPLPAGDLPQVGENGHRVDGPIAAAPVEA